MNNKIKASLRILEKPLGYSSNIYDKKNYRVIVKGDKYYVMVVDHRRTRKGFARKFNLVLILEALVYCTINGVFRNFTTLGYVALINVNEQTVCGSCVIGNYYLKRKRVYHSGLCMGRPECIKIISEELGLEAVITSYNPSRIIQCREVEEKLHIIYGARGEELIPQTLYVCYF